MPQCPGRPQILGRQKQRAMYNQTHILDIKSIFTNGSLTHVLICTFTFSPMINSLVLFSELVPFHCGLSPTAWTSHRKRHGVECSAWLDLHGVELGELPAGSLYSDTSGRSLWVAPNDPPKGPTSNFVFWKAYATTWAAKLAWGIFEALALQSCTRMYRI